MRFLVALLVWCLRAVFTSRGALALENLALRQQLATYVRGREASAVEVCGTSVLGSAFEGVVRVALAARVS